MSQRNLSAVFKSQVVAALLALTCLLAGVQSYTLREAYDTDCSVVWCLKGVDYNCSEMEFCNQAQRADSCIGRVLTKCIDQFALLQGLSLVDLPSFYEKKGARCS